MLARILELLNHLAQDNIFIFITGIASITGLLIWLLSTILHKLGFRLIKKKISYAIRTIPVVAKNTNLVKGQDLISIKYKDETVPNLFFSKIALFNSGLETIEKEDIAPSDFLRIAFKEPENILICKISYLSRKSNKIAFKKAGFTEINYNNKSKVLTRESILENREIIIDFDFISRRDGACIQLAHTNSILEKSLEIIGDFKESRNKIIEIEKDINLLLKATFFILLSIILFSVAIIFLDFPDANSAFIVFVICSVLFSIRSFSIASPQYRYWLDKIDEKIDGKVLYNFWKDDWDLNA